MIVRRLNSNLTLNIQIGDKSYIGDKSNLKYDKNKGEITLKGLGSLTFGDRELFRDIRNGKVIGLNWQSEDSYKSKKTPRIQYIQVNNKVSQAAPKITKLENKFPDWNIYFDPDGGTIELARHDRQLSIDSGNENFQVYDGSKVIYSTYSLDSLLRYLNKELR